MTAITLSVPDISCNHCKDSIEGALNPLDGVDSATVSIPERVVTVSFDADTVGLDAIVEAIGEQGYEVADV
jgi:copper chaperone